MQEGVPEQEGARAYLRACSPTRTAAECGSLPAFLPSSAVPYSGTAALNGGVTCRAKVQPMRANYWIAWTWACSIIDIVRGGRSGVDVRHASARKI